MAEREAAAAASKAAPGDEDRSSDAADEPADSVADGGSGDAPGRPSSPPLPPSSFVPESTRDYSRIEYWDKRFETEEEYEWCGRYEDFRSLLVAALKGGGGDGPRAARRVLVLGSGTSRLPFDLAAEEELLPGLEEVVATDLSAVAVEKMAARTLQEEAAERDDGRKKTAPISWQVADMLSLPFSDGSFDAVIDKGVLDALFAGFGGGGGGGGGAGAGGGGGGGGGGDERRKQRYDKWRPRETAPELWELAQRALRESLRVLSPEGGRYVQISFEQPHFRRPFLDAPGLGWRRGGETAFGEEGGLQFFFYLRRRGGGGGVGDGGDGGEGGEGALAPAGAFEIPSGYEPVESPMHDHMDEEDFLMRTSL